MSDPHFWLFTLLLVGVTIAAFYGVFRFWRRARLIEDTPTSRIRSASQGYVELDGTAELMEGDPILAPLTLSRCTWYSFKVEKKTEHYDSKGHRRTSWRTIRSGTSEELFLLVEDTGQCVIDPEGAEVTPSSKDVWLGDSEEWGGGKAPKQGFRFGDYRYRYTEKRIEPADSLYAIGEFRSVGGPNEVPNSREEMRQLINDWKKNQAAMLKHFDKDGNGEIDMKEWEVVRKTAEQVVKRQQAKRATQPATHMMSRPKDGRPYILSVLPQEVQSRRYRQYAAGLLFLFLVAGATASWMLAARMLSAPVS